MEDLLRIADRTEGLPDQALAQLTQAGGIEGVIAASEMKARNDIRQEASAMQNMPQPPVINQLLATAMRPTMPAGPMAQGPMQPQTQQPMPNPMMTLQSMQPAPMPMAKVGGLVRRFQQGSQGTLGLSDFYQQQLGYDPSQLLSMTNVFADPSLQLNQQMLDNFAQQYSDIQARTDFDEDIEDQFRKETTARNLFSLIGQQPAASPSGTLIQSGLQAGRQRAAVDALQQLGLPVGSVQQLPQVSTGQTVPAFVPQGQRLNVLPSTFTQPFANVATSGQPPAVTSAQPSTKVSSGAINQSSQASTTPQNVPDDQTGGVQLPPGYNAAMQFAMDIPAFGGALRSNPQNLMASVNALANMAGGGTSDTLKSTATGINNQMFSDLIAREKQYKTEVDNSLNKLKDLEAELPSKDNIKNRIKKQTDLGVASAFFNAAGNATPSFIETISKGLAGASNVMNKFSGQEQKELYQYAIDAYGREKDKANTAYQRQQDNLKRINDARTLEATYATAASKNATSLANKQMDLYFQAVTKGLDIDKFEAEQKDKFRDDVRAAIKDFNTTASGFTDINQRLGIDEEQARIRLAVGGYEQMYVPEARRLVDNSIKEIIPRLAGIEKSIREDNPTLSNNDVARQVSAQIYKDFRDNNELGHEAVLNKYGAELGAIARARPEDKAELLRQFKQRYRWIDEKYVSSRLPNI